jgi:hypothetical protein
MSNPSMTHQPTLKFKQMRAARDSVDQGFITTNPPSDKGGRRGGLVGGEVGVEEKRRPNLRRHCGCGGAAPSGRFLVGGM